MSKWYHPWCILSLLIRLWAGQLGFESWLRHEIFALHENVQASSGVTQPHIQLVLGGLSLAVRQPGHKVKNECNITYYPTICLHGIDRDSFRFFIKCYLCFFTIKPTRCTNFTNLFWHETLHVSCQNKFVKLVHLVGFIVNKFVTMHGHTNVKLVSAYCKL